MWYEYIVLSLQVGTLCTMIFLAAKDAYKAWRIRKGIREMEATRDQWDDPDYKTINNGLL